MSAQLTDVVQAACFNGLFYDSLIDRHVIKEDNDKILNNHCKSGTESKLDSGIHSRRKQGNNKGHSTRKQQRSELVITLPGLFSQTFIKLKKL